MANRSDSEQIGKCLIAVVLAGSLVASGCAGLVMGTNSINGGGTPAAGSPPPTSTPQAQLSVTPSSANFPGVAIGSSSSQTITLQNDGTASATVSTVSVTGAGFSTTGLTLPASIAAGQAMTFNLVFTPMAGGNFSGSLTLNSDAPNSPILVAASGSATAPTAVLGASATSLNFGTVAVGSSTSAAVNLTNTGNASVTISSVVLTGAGFTASGLSTNMSISPGQTAAVNVTFAPTIAGTVVGSIAISSNAGAMSIALGGIGGQLSSHTVALTWDPSTSDVVGYYVYRVLSDGTYTKINAAPVALTDYTDNSVVSGETYTYVVTAVTSDSVESDYSDPVVATIP
jgi:hypothetical protein